MVTAPTSNPMRSRLVAATRTVALSLGVALGVTACRPAPGLGASLEIRTPKADEDADVYVDGRYVGRVSALGGFTLAPGLHRVEVRKPGRFPVQKTVRVEMTPLATTTTVVDAELLENPLE